MKIANRMEGFTSFIVMDVLEEALRLESRGCDIVHLEIGEPDFDPPAPVVEAMQRAVRDGRTHYTHSLGIQELREAIARRYFEKYGVEVSPERVCVTAGTSAAFLLLLGALVNPGDRVAMSDPGYACYPNFVRFTGGRPMPIPIEAEDGFQLTPEAILQSPLEETSLFVISSPANPTGTLTGRATYECICEQDCRLISDEIYHDLVYTGEREMTGLEVSDEVIVVDGFSKRYAMTGLRLGWAVVPPWLVRPMNRLAQNIYICPPTPAQYGGIAALLEGGEAVARMRQEYAQRRRLLLEGLRELGFRVAFEPQGAFYLFADVSAFAEDSYEFTFRMLKEAGVAATPGLDFGNNKTKRYVRFAYTQRKERISEALRRLSDWLPGTRLPGSAAPP